MVVPRELILSRENIDVFAKSDQHLKEVLDSLGDFGRVRDFLPAARNMADYMLLDDPDHCLDLLTHASHHILS